MTDDRLSSEDLDAMRALAVRGRYVPPRHVVKLIDEVREWRTSAAREPTGGVPNDRALGKVGRG